MVQEKDYLNENQQKLFHTMVARLLYLSKRVRPDILTAVGYLCTRVKQPSKNDQEKLFRVIGYLEGTKEESLK